MVHNGIEYGDMQLICEAYHLMRDGLGMTADEMHAVFAEWNKGELDSYLVEITRDILAFKDADGQPLVDKILDTAGQKGNGQMDCHQFLRTGRADYLDYRGCIFPVRFSNERGTSPGVQSAQRPQSQNLGGPSQVHRRYSPSPLCLEDRVLHPGLHADARGGGSNT